MKLLSQCQHALSRAMGWLANCNYSWISQPLIFIIQKRFKITLEEVEDKHFKTLNAFFTRKLRPEARPIAQHPAIVCPADGLVSGCGTLQTKTIMPVKGHDYTLGQIFGPHQDLAQHFEDGHFASYYLAPNNYHRVHCPMDADLKHMLAIPGSLYTVDHNRSSMPRDVFAKNERVAAVFQVDGGWMAVVFVGATMVGSIHTVWSGQVMPPLGPHIDRQDYTSASQHFKRGQELGHFQFGSSIILLCSKGVAKDWHTQLSVDASCQVGIAIAEILTKEK